LLNAPEGKVENSRVTYYKSVSQVRSPIGLCVFSNYPLFGSPEAVTKYSRPKPRKLYNFRYDSCPDNHYCATWSHRQNEKNL